LGEVSTPLEAGEESFGLLRDGPILQPALLLVLVLTTVMMSLLTFFQFTTPSAGVHILFVV
jgi:hypothetical protein